MELVRHPRHSRYGGLAELIPDQDGDLGVLLMEPGLDVPHGDVGSVEGWAGETGGDDADLMFCGVGGGGDVRGDDYSAFACGGSPFDGESHASFWEG